MNNVKFYTVLFLSLVSVASLSFAQEVIEVTSQTQIQVSCPVADVSFSEVAQKNINLQAQLVDGSKIRGSGWSFRTEKNSSQVTIFCEPPESILMNPGQLRYQIQMRGPSVPLSIHLKSGLVDLTNLKGPIHATVEKGQIKLSQTSQLAKLNVIQGSIDVQKHTGRLRIEGYESKTRVENVEGNVSVNQFSGSINLKNIVGEISIQGKKPQVLVDSSSGGLRFDLDAGKLDLENLSGSIEGVSDKSIIQAKLLNPVRFKIKSKSAQLKISVPSSSGAQVNMAISEGQFQVPSFLSQDSSGAVKTVRGTLRGGETGRLNVTAESGRVQLLTY